MSRARLLLKGDRVFVGNQPGIVMEAVPAGYCGYLYRVRVGPREYRVCRASQIAREPFPPLRLVCIEGERITP